jgi:hypothetical protein
VLVKNQASAKENGIYIASTADWSRSADADTSGKVTPNLYVCVEEGLAQADTRWQLVSNGPVVLGVSAMNFQNVTHGFALLASPVFSGSPKAPTPAQFQDNEQLANAAFVQQALGNLRGSVVFKEDRLLTPQESGKLIIGETLNMVLTLPDATKCKNGACLHIHVSPRINSLWVETKEGQTAGGKAAKTPTRMQLYRASTVSFMSDGKLWHVATATGSALFKENGYTRHPNGFIEQWVTGLSDNSGQLRLSLPIQFPNQILGGCANEAHPDGWGEQSTTVWAFNLSASSPGVAVAYVRRITGTSGPTINDRVSGRIQVWGW